MSCIVCGMMTGCSVTIPTGTVRADNAWRTVPACVWHTVAEVRKTIKAKTREWNKDYGNG